MSAANVLKFLKEKEAEFVDLRFTDPRGKLQHLTMDVTVIDEDMLNDGVFFDGSSIAGWKAINESDMTLMPDLYRAYVDPFFAQPTLALFCDVLEFDFASIPDVVSISSPTVVFWNVQIISLTG